MFSDFGETLDSRCSYADETSSRLAYWACGGAWKILRGVSDVGWAGLDPANNGLPARRNCQFQLLLVFRGVATSLAASTLI
jgi:hypothetical protein